MDENTAASTRKKISLSGIQPSGAITLGNYLGAFRNWVALQDEYDCLYFIANQHAITVRQDPAALRQRTLEAYAATLAVGVDPVKSIAFIQSHLTQPAELAWVLDCYTQFGELSRMTQFKDKSAKNADNINAGLFTYPVLMAADILLYQSDVVPVGDDQKQHVEIARDIAGRFNAVHGGTFTVPEPLIGKVGARIMSLQDPTRKMSKSDPNPKACIYIFDDPDAIIKKFKSAVTDSEAVVEYRTGKDGINNLMAIYSIVTGKDFDTIRDDFAGRGYGDFKLAVGEAVAAYLAPIRQRYQQLLGDKAYLEACYTDGARRAARIAERTLDKVYRKVGFPARLR